MGTSKGALKLLSLIHELYPGQPVTEEFYLGSTGLRLDYYIEPLSLAFEYHGRQHDNFVPHFHGNRGGFSSSLARDAAKAEYCDCHGIRLVVIWHHSAPATKEELFHLVELTPLTTATPPTPTTERKSSFSSMTPVQKERRRVQNREAYSKLAEYRKARKKAADEPKD